MSELEETNGSFPKENPGNPLPSSVASFALVFQSPEFVSKALLPTIGAHQHLASHIVQAKLDD